MADDVLNSGKTLMYSSKFFLNTKLKKLSILVLIDRNHNLFPIKADYVGLSLSTTLQEYIDVNLTLNQKGVCFSLDIVFISNPSISIILLAIK